MKIQINFAPGKPETLFPVVCSWCGNVKGFSMVENSHGICPHCATVWRENAKGIQGNADGIANVFATFTPEELAEYDEYSAMLDAQSGI